MPALAVLAKARLEKTALSLLVDRFSTRYTASDRLQNIDSKKVSAVLAKWIATPNLAMTDLSLAAELHSVNTLDGLRLTLKNQDIVHIRPSGNAPELRCYTESNTAEKADALLCFVMAQLPRYS